MNSHGPLITFDAAQVHLAGERGAGAASLFCQGFVFGQLGGEQPQRDLFPYDAARRVYDGRFLRHGHGVQFCEWVTQSADYTQFA